MVAVRFVHLNLLERILGTADANAIDLFADRFVLRYELELPIRAATGELDCVVPAECRQVAGQGRADALDQGSDLRMIVERDRMVVTIALGDIEGFPRSTMLSCAGSVVIFSSELGAA